MNNSQPVWIPTGQNLEKGQSNALAVQARAKPTRDQYRDLLAIQLQQIVDADKTEAMSAMEMSLDQLPELYLIASSEPPRNWGESLASSDSMQNLLNRIDWTQPGIQSSRPLPSLREVLEQLP